MNQEIIDKHFLRVAWLTCINLSKDPNTQVGACTVSADSRQVSTGYNGMPSGLEEYPEIWNNRDLKHKYVIHAEINSLLNCPFDTKGCFLYCTHFPCHRCLGPIINAGIVRIVYNEDYSGLANDKNVVDTLSPLVKNIKQYSCDDFVNQLRKDRDNLKLTSCL